jgi:hypothetical protein
VSLKASAVALSSVVDSDSSLSIIKCRASQSHTIFTRNTSHPSSLRIPTILAWNLLHSRKISQQSSKTVELVVNDSFDFAAKINHTQKAAQSVSVDELST